MATPFVAHRAKNGGAEDLNIELLLKNIIGNPNIYQSVSKIPLTKIKEEYNSYVHYSLSIIY